MSNEIVEALLKRGWGFVVEVEDAAAFLPLLQVPPEKLNEDQLDSVLHYMYRDWGEAVEDYFGALDIPFDDEEITCYAEEVYKIRKALSIVISWEQEMTAKISAIWNYKVRKETGVLLMNGIPIAYGVCKP